VKGVRVVMRLLWNQGRHKSNAFVSSSFETMSMAIAPNTFGEQKVLVLLVNFQDRTDAAVDR
jgi:hypothetical protein